MFIAALFKITKIRKPPKCPSTDQWIINIGNNYVPGYIHAYIYVCMYIVCVYIYIWNIIQP